MRSIYLLIIIVFALATLIFAVQNLEVVTVSFLNMNVGAPLALLVLIIYGPVLLVALSQPGTAVKVEGINYFADTLLFAGVILALASATPRPD